MAKCNIIRNLVKDCRLTWSVDNCLKNKNTSQLFATSNTKQNIYLSINIYLPIRGSYTEYFFLSTLTQTIDNEIGRKRQIFVRSRHASLLGESHCRFSEVAGSSPTGIKKIDLRI